MFMKKYEVQYQNLVKKYCPDRTAQLLEQTYYSSASSSINNELVDVMEHNNDENVDNTQQEIGIFC